ncbi:MAG: pantoate--beta-alanine ligase [archaeon]
MLVINRSSEMQAECRRLRQNGTMGYVPTMGCLHEGHLSLVRRARQENDAVAVSIYVNPTQFSAGEDLSSYPRELERDLRLCEKEGVDILFYPDDAEMYPEGFCTHTTVSGLDRIMCGKSRPTHFQGVCTVVCKLFNIVQPDSAYFGQKDYQQAVIIKRMAKDLNMGIKIMVCPVVRETDGLAMSSRNSYLSGEERAKAPEIYAALREARDSILNKGSVAGAINRIEKRVNRVGRLDYAVAADPETLMHKEQRPLVLAVAAYVGSTRLIDNILIE